MADRNRPNHPKRPSQGAKCPSQGATASRQGSRQRAAEPIVDLHTFKRKRLRQFARQQRQLLDQFFCAFHDRHPLPPLRTLYLSSYSGYDTLTVPPLFSEDYLIFRDRLSTAVKIQLGEQLISELKTEPWFPRSLWPFQDDVIEWYVSYLVLRLPETHNLPYS